MWLYKRCPSGAINVRTSQTHADISVLEFQMPIVTHRVASWYPGVQISENVFIWGIRFTFIYRLSWWYSCPLSETRETWVRFLVAAGCLWKLLWIIASIRPFTFYMNTESELPTDIGWYIDPLIYWPYRLLYDFHAYRSISTTISRNRKGFTLNWIELNWIECMLWQINVLMAICDVFCKKRVSIYIYF